MKKLIVGICAALLGFMSLSALAEVYDPRKGDPRIGYEDKGSLPKGSTVLLDKKVTLSKVIGVRGDLWLFHSAQTLPWLFTCDGPLETTANKEGVYHWNYDEATDTATCEFQGKWNNQYLMTVTVKFTQSGLGVLGEVIWLAYPYDWAYGSKTYGKSGTWGNGMNYYTSLDPNETTGQVRMSLHNVELVEEGETRNVKFYSKDGEFLKEENVPYGEAATPPTPPEVAGYEFSKWKPDVSSVKANMITTACYRKPKTANSWVLTKEGNNYYISQGDWKLAVACSGDELTLQINSSHKSAPTQSGVLDLTESIFDANDKDYNITELASYALSGWSNYGKMTEVRLPKTLTTIGSYAFKQCPNLTNVVFETGSDIRRLDDQCFMECPKLAKLTPGFPSSVTYIGWAALYNCPALRFEGDKLSLGKIGGSLSFGSMTSFAYIRAKEVDLLSSGVSISKNTFEATKTNEVPTVRDFRIHDSWNAPIFPNNSVFDSTPAKARRYFIPKGMPRSFTVDALGSGDLELYKTKFGEDEPEPIGLKTLGTTQFFVVEYVDSLLAKDGLLVMADPANIGADKVSPTYGLYKPTRPMTCTNKASVVEHQGVRYMCVGYTLQKLENGILTDVKSSSAKSVTIPDDDTMYVLKWKWADEGVKLNLVMPTIPFPTDPIGSVQINGEPGTASSFHALNSTVTLKAVPAAGARFDHWEGDVPDDKKLNSEIEITMSAEKTVNAIFHANSWLYLASENRITDGAWKLGVTRSGTDLTLDTEGKMSWSFPGCASIMDLSMPIRDQNDVSYQIVALAYISINGADGRPCANTVADFRMPNTIKTLGNYCVRCLNALTNLVLSTSLESVGALAFDTCPKLKNVTPFLPPTLLSFGTSPFNGTAVTNRLTLGAKGKSFSLSGDSFAGTQIQEVEILGNITSLGTGWHFGSSSRVRKFYVHGNPFPLDVNLCAYVAAGKQVWFIPRGNTAWDEWLTTNLTPWDEETMRAAFQAEFPEITKPTPLGKARFGRADWQWVVPWSPVRQPLVFTIR